MTGYRPAGGNYFDRYSGAFPPAIKWLLIANVAMFILPRMLFPISIAAPHPGPGAGQLIWDQVLPLAARHLHVPAWRLLAYPHEYVYPLDVRPGARTTPGVRANSPSFISSRGSGPGSLMSSSRPSVASMASIPIIGASGAIYGILVAYAMLFPERYVYVYFMIPVKVKYLVIFLVALEFFSGLPGRWHRAFRPPGRGAGRIPLSAL